MCTTNAQVCLHNPWVCHVLSLSLCSDYVNPPSIESSALWHSWSCVEPSGDFWWSRSQGVRLEGQIEEDDLFIQLLRSGIGHIFCFHFVHGVMRRAPRLSTLTLFSGGWSFHAPPPPHRCRSLWDPLTQDATEILIPSTLSGVVPRPRSVALWLIGPSGPYPGHIHPWNSVTWGRRRVNDDDCPS